MFTSQVEATFANILIPRRTERQTDRQAGGRTFRQAVKQESQSALVAKHLP